MFVDEPKTKIAVVGLGYVGLPLAIEFSKYFEVIAFDINISRVKELKSSFDSTYEFQSHELDTANNIKYTYEFEDLKESNFYIVCVPTPIDKEKKPNLDAINNATKLVAQQLNKNDIVVYESTVYPGLTEEYCVPILEKISKLTYNKDFFCGYSPERINPGDKKHKLKDIIKITSGSTPEVAKYIDQTYSKIIKAGTHLAPSIMVAEAAKVIENTQRDLNIALINELSIIFNKLDISTEDVIDAASTKWNFIRFTPGLVGGHCIGVDPYYLTTKSINIGHNPEIILAGRKLNDAMGSHVADVLIQKMIKTKISVENSKVLIMGITFKENCFDTRNTKVFDIGEQLEKSEIKIDYYDPYVNDRKIDHINMIDRIDDIYNIYDAVIIAVAHKEFKNLGIEKIKMICKPKSIIFDLKWIFDKNETDLRL